MKCLALQLSRAVARYSHAKDKSLVSKLPRPYLSHVCAPSRSLRRSHPRGRRAECGRWKSSGAPLAGAKPGLACAKQKGHPTGCPFCFASARRGSNPRPPPWQGGAPPLSHSRISLYHTTLINLLYRERFVNTFLLFLFYTFACKVVYCLCFQK